MPTPSDHSPTLPPATISLLSGALAGTTVDTTLFPLDTVKTRLQSRQGFLASGGFRHLYRGLGPVLVFSAPSAALFFVTYDTAKRLPSPSPSPSPAATHMLAACLGELAACTVRVPTEVLKQRAQARQCANAREAFWEIWSLRRGGGGVVGAAGAGAGAGAGTGATGAGRRGANSWGGGGWRMVLKELYRGGGVTVMREIPFTVIQFPLWEGLKTYWGAHKQKSSSPITITTTTTTTTHPHAHITPLESALFGSLSGGLAALITTPLDVLKTRIMLSRQHLQNYATTTTTTSTTTATAPSATQILKQLIREEGPAALVKGWAPRVVWISIGGAVFLGAYDAARQALESL